MNDMDYNIDFSIWDSASISIVNIRHGLLFRQSTTEMDETSSFVFCIGKNGGVTVDGVPYKFDSHCLMHVAPNKHMFFEAEKNEVEYFIISYHAELLPSASREVVSRLLTRNPFSVCSVIKTSNPAYFSENFTKITDLWSKRDISTQLKIKSIFYAIIHGFYAELISINPEKCKCKLDYYEYASNFLHDNYSKEVSIQQLAETLGIARTTLYEAFKSKTGISPQQYLTQLRLDAACKELEKGTMSIDEIAVSCGLNDRSFFHRVFKQKYGISPGDYRKNHLTGSMKIQPTLNKKQLSVQGVIELRRTLNHCFSEVCTS